MSSTSKTDLHLAFPLAIFNGLPAVSDYELYVAQLIEQVLLTMPGERVNRPTFGCGIMQMVMQPMSEQMVAATQFLVQSQLQQATSGYATIQNTTVAVVGTELEIMVAYTIPASAQVLSTTVRRTLYQGSVP